MVTNGFLMNDFPTVTGEQADSFEPSLGFSPVFLFIIPPTRSMMSIKPDAEPITWDAAAMEQDRCQKQP